MSVANRFQPPQTEPPVRLHLISKRLDRQRDNRTKTADEK
jgi:hypothetical protein